MHDYGVLVARHLEAENAHKLEETLATLHADCLFEDMALGRRFHGRDGAAEYYRLWWSAFDVVVAGGQRYWPSEDVLIAEARYEGRHVGDFLGLAPTGRAVELKFAVFISFKEGLMASERFYYDLGSLLLQIGATALPNVPR